MFGFLHLPVQAVAGNKIDKKVLYDNADLNANEKRWLKDDVEKITWEYRIAQDTVNIRGYINESVDYSEIQVIGIELRSDSHVTGVSDILFKSMPYPLIVIAVFSGRIFITAAHVHINQNDRSRLTVEEPVRSGWIDGYDQLLEMLDMSVPGPSDLKELYTRFIDSLLRFKVSEETGSEVLIDAAASADLLNKLAVLDKDISKLMTELKKEDHFNRQVELNGRIKKLQMDRQRLLDALDRE